MREDETRKLKQEREKIDKVKEVSAKTKQGQEQAFEIIEQAERLLDQEKFDEALEEYKKAITILEEILRDFDTFKNAEGIAPKSVLLVLGSNT